MQAQKLELVQNNRNAIASKIDGSIVSVDLRSNGDVRDLYIEEPYFLDVLRWMNGDLAFEKIGHFYTDEQFRARVLPELKGRMLKAGLLSIVNGTLVPAFKSIVLKNVPEGIATRLVLAEHFFKGVKRCAAGPQGDLAQLHLRCRVSKDCLAQFVTKVDLLLAELDSLSNDRGERATVSLFVGSEGAESA